MVINNFRNVCKCDKISCNRQVNFRGVMKMEKDTFQKNLNSYTVNSISYDEYEGHLNFSNVGKKEKSYFAYFEISDASKPLPYKKNMEFKAKIRVEEIEKAVKVSEDTPKILSQPLKNSTTTDFVAKITQSLGEGVFMAKVDDFTEEIELSINDNDNFQIGDLIKARGYLAVDFQ